MVFSVKIIKTERKFVFALRKAERYHQKKGKLQNALLSVCFKGGITVRL